jgi:hypothetical protein
MPKLAVATGYNFRLPVFLDITFYVINGRIIMSVKLRKQGIAEIPDDMIYVGQEDKGECNYY